MSRTIISFIALLTIMAFAMFNTGCPAETTTTTTTVSDIASLKVSLTDAPAGDFSKVEVNFDKVEVAMSGSSNAEWLVINEDGGLIDLLSLNNGKLQSLGIKELKAGQYNQIRIAVSSVALTLKDGTSVDSSKVHLASNTIKLVKPFTLKEGITTELIVDFDAGHSISKTGTTPSLYSYTMTPVTRLASVDTTGAFKGSVTPIDGKTITVTAYQDGSTNAYAGTVCDASGDWMIGYLEAGTYDIKIETTDSSADIADKVITVGNVTTIDKVTLGSTSTTTTTTTTIPTSLKLSLTDAPATDFSKVEVNFDKVEVAMSKETNAEWLTICEDAGVIDLLALNNAKLEEIGIKELAAGQYNQIRIAVSSVSITLKDGTVVDSSKIHLASNTIKLVKPFTIEEGKMTELVVDFDASHSIVMTGTLTSQYSFTITPVSRLAIVKETGKLKGSVTPISNKTITVTAFQNGSTNAYAGTVCDASGDWMIGYLETGTYDIKIETTDSSADIADKVIEVGKTTTTDKKTL